jgi:hypothetical protein
MGQYKGLVLKPDGSTTLKDVLKKMFSFPAKDNSSP